MLFYFNSKFTIKNLNESILISLLRDLITIITKIKIVLFPFVSEESLIYFINNWDLWGPLYLNLFLAYLSSVNSENNKTFSFSFIFFIFWIGGLIIYLNFNFLGIKITFFQLLSVCGYCLIPINIISIVLYFCKFISFVKVVLIIFSYGWSIFSVNKFIKIKINKEQRSIMVLYPFSIFYLMIISFLLFN